MKSKKISFCTVAMNRIHHIQKTLPKNIEDNKDYDDLEFVLLDYNSTDGLEEWVKNNLMEYINIGKLHYYKTSTPSYFDRSHSRNIAFRLSKGEILCNIDADNYTGRGYASYINKIFTENENIFLTADTKRRYYFLRNAFGRYCVTKEDFQSIKGLNEDMKSYGSETVDFYERLEQADIKEKVILNTDFLKAISHGDEERISNEYFTKELRALYIQYVSYDKSNILMLFKNNKFEKVAISPETDEPHLPASIVKPGVQVGEWKLTNEKLELLFSDADTHFLNQTDEGLISTAQMTEPIFHKITDEKFLINFAKNYSFLSNVGIKQATKQKGVKLVNENGYGQDKVYHNFLNTPIILN